MAPVRLRLVLVGAGHAHLYVVRHAAALRAAGVEPVLVAPSTFHYSGLATGVLSGALTADRAQIDAAALAAHFGVRHIAAEATSVDRLTRRLRLADGQDLPWDAVSFNVGSVTPDPLGLTTGADVWPTKPLSGLYDLRSRIESYKSNIRIIIAGGGPSGFEIAAALAGLVERNLYRPDIQLACKSPPGWAPPRALSQLAKTLRRRGIVVTPGEVVARSDGACRLSSGASLPCDLLVLATGLSAAPVVATLGLPTTDQGRLEVGPTLQSIADPWVFAVGDCSDMAVARQPAAGIFGVRAAPVLLHNLIALGSGASMRRYRPQRRWLSIMDLGDGNGLAMRGRLWWMGPGALALKRRLDLGFIAAMRAPSGKPLED